MTHIEVRLGRQGDLDDAVSVYERSNLARRQGSMSQPTIADVVSLLAQLEPFEELQAAQAGWCVRYLTHSVDIA